MAAAKNQNSPAAVRRAKLEEARRKERARERRGRLLTIGASVAVVTALVAGGGYLVYQANEKEKAASGPISGERTWKDLKQGHVETKVDYPMTPPVGGDHSQVWMNCNADVYTEEIPNENAVHSLEHGAVWVTYNEDASEADIKTLTEKVKKTPYSLMSPVKDQKDPLMLSAWGKQVTVKDASDSRVGQFFSKYVQGPQTPEPGAACTGGRDK
ncbi:DUF3105 domain-containing protein [Streptomyces sp. NPDC059452]|uniref:DUF3105 domain-containing protein n=1 Tax=Streptomyces sp. NPDC059452 TaxID=3346835 RepID=UPI00367855FB